MNTAFDNLLELKDKEITLLESRLTMANNEARRTRYMIRMNAIKYGIFFFIVGLIIGLVL